MPAITKLDPSVNPQSVIALKAKNYDSQYTNIPHSALPTEVATGVGSVYQSLTGQELTESTWTIMAKEGVFSKLYGPSFGKITVEGVSTPTLKWGQTLIPATIKDGKITFPGTKVTGKFTSVTLNGYLTIGLLIKTKEYLFPVGIRLASFEEDSRPDADTLDSLLEGNEFDVLMEFFGELSTGSGGGSLDGEVIALGQLPAGDYEISVVKPLKSTYTPYMLQSKALGEFIATVSYKEGEEWLKKQVTVAADSNIIIKIPAAMASLVKEDGQPFTLTVDASMREIELSGPVVKIAELPLGSYAILGYRELPNSKYTPFLVQSEAIQDMEVPSSRRVLNGDKNEWEVFTADVKAGERFIIKPNAKFSEKLAARPIVTEEAPGELLLLEAGEFNGFKTMKLSTNFREFSVRANELNLHF